MAVDTFKSKYVYSAYDEVCIYCEISLDEGGRSIDHIIPRSQGGSDNVENLVPACKDCNGARKWANLLGVWMSDHDRAYQIIKQANFVARAASEKILAYQVPWNDEVEGLVCVWPIEVVAKMSAVKFVVESEAMPDPNPAVHRQVTADGAGKQAVDVVHTSLIEDINVWLQSRASSCPKKLVQNFDDYVRKNLKVYV